MYGVDLVGVEIVENDPTLTGGRGARRPPAVGFQIWRVGWTNFMKFCEECNLLATLKELAGQLVNFRNPRKKTEISPKSTKTQKNTKIVRMTSYLQSELSKKLASQKYRVLIFKMNEGDFSGTPQKNQ